MFDSLDIFQTNVTIGDEWMYNMGRGAQVNDLTVEMCTTYPRHNMAALKMKTVTIVSLILHFVKLKYFFNNVIV